MIFSEWFNTQKILTKNDLENGNYVMFGDDNIEYGGEYGQQLVYIEGPERGPITNITYEYFEGDEGNEIFFYRGYKNGYIDGPQVYFYEGGKLKSISFACVGSSMGPRISFYENGIAKEEGFYCHGQRLFNAEYDENGIIKKLEKSYRKDDIDYMKKRFPDTYLQFEKYVVNYLAQES